MFYPAWRALDNGREEVEWKASLAFPDFCVFRDGEYDPAEDNPEDLMNNPTARKVLGVATMTYEGRLAVEVLFGWGGLAMVERCLFSDERSRNMYVAAVKGVGRHFFSLPPKRQVDMRITQQGGVADAHVVFRYNRS